MVAQLVTLTSGIEIYPGYKLCRFLGRGGWGEVWKALGKDGKSYALKFLPCSSPQAASREIRGLQSVRQLIHPNIIDIHQVWADSRYIVIAMELAEGSLQDIFEVYFDEYEEPISAEFLMPLMSQAAAALDFLNTRQHMINGRRVAVRHCDVKPSNLLLVGKSLKLADFSLAVQATASMCYHEKVGTLNFAAPEVLQGWLSDRSDQYSLAVTYCQLRMGMLPYPPAPPKRIRYDRDYVRPPPDLSYFEPEERKIIGRALCTTPQDRWPTCSEFIFRLQELL